MPVDGIGRSGMSINNPVVLNVEAGVSIGIFEKELDFVFACAPVDRYKVF